MWNDRDFIVKYFLIRWPIAHSPCYLWAGRLGLSVFLLVQYFHNMTDCLLIGWSTRSVRLTSQLVTQCLQSASGPPQPTVCTVSSWPPPPSATTSTSWTSSWRWVMSASGIQTSDPPVWTINLLLLRCSQCLHRIYTVRYLCRVIAETTAPHQVNYIYCHISPAKKCSTSLKRAMREGTR